MAVKCKVTAKLKLTPDAQGRCPQCLSEVKASEKTGIIGVHTIKGIDTDPTLPAVDATGTDVSAASLRRGVENLSVAVGSTPIPTSRETATQGLSGGTRGAALVRGSEITGEIPPERKEGDKPKSGTMERKNAPHPRADRKIIKGDPKTDPRRDRPYGGTHHRYTYGEFWALTQGAQRRERRRLAAIPHSK